MILVEAAPAVEDAGADFLLIGTNTMHRIALLVGRKDTDLALYDTTAIHAARAVEWALSSD